MKSMTSYIWGGSRLQPSPVRVKNSGDLSSYV
jgi:hypothetical protein